MENRTNISSIQGSTRGPASFPHLKDEKKTSVLSEIYQFGC